MLSKHTCDIDDEFSRIENPNLLEDTSKYYVELTHSGNWSLISENTTVYLNGYHDLLNISNQLHPKQNFVRVVKYMKELKNYISHLI